MTTSRRDILLAAGSIGFASLSSNAPAKETSDLDKTVAELVTRSEQANSAFMSGDIAAYRTLITLSDDFSFMGPFGGGPSSSADFTDEVWEAIGRNFKNGRLRQELVQAYASADIVVLVVIEHNRGEVSGLPEQAWPLRVTIVYRRVGSEWLLAHRHADPLVKDITVAEAAALARR